MPYELAVRPIETALRAILVADTTLAGLLATKPAARGGGPAIYDDGDVPQGAVLPYLTIGAWTQIGFHSMGDAYGWNCTGQIKAIGQNREDPVLAILSRVFTLLPQGKRLTVTGYGSAWCDEFVLHPTITTTVAGVTTFEAPGILRLYVHDT